VTTTTSRRPTSAATAAAPRRPAAPRRGRDRWLLVGLSVALVVVALVAAGTGAYRVPAPEIVASLLDRIGVAAGPLPDPVATSVLWEVRFPRVVLAILVGACLGVAGAVLQGVFGNPLAEPAIIGVSSGAAVGAAATIVLGLAAFGSASVVVAAFVGGLVATALVYGLSRAGGRTEVVTLVLTGIAVNAIGGALIGLLAFVADDAQLRSLTFWNLGSVGSATWRAVAGIAPVALVGLLLAPRFARTLDLLALGERSARHLGVDVERVRLQLIVVSALLTAAAVSVAGIIAFVGLVVPHLLRTLAGPGHRVLLPGSALLGALVLVGADLAARTIAAPAEVPLGVLTGLVGAPCFLWLLRRTRQRQGGWA
jgi:iron complex transport system permease protein